MEIDTLVLSGASTKVIAFIGIFRALYEKGILSPDLKGIKHISCVSVGFLYGLMLCLKVSEKVCYECTIKTDFLSLLDLGSLDFNSIIDDMGLIDHSKIQILIRPIIRDIFKKEDITLLELYEYSNIKLSVKCANVTKQHIEIFDHIKHPDMSILKLLLMTTAIPIFFKPIMYNDYYYIDGGINGNMATEPIDSENYLCININQKVQNFKAHEFPIIPFMLRLCCISTDSYEKYKDRTILVVLDVITTNFDLSEEEKKDMIKISYDSTILQIEDKFKRS